VGMDGKSHQVKLESGYKVIAPFIKIMKPPRCKQRGIRIKKD
jgi:hypothetical protein